LTAAPDGLRVRIAALLDAHTTLTLATADASGAPAAAAVFYARDQRAGGDGALCLYFLSEPDTRHGRRLLANPAVAATIQADGQDWRRIRGLQLEGRAAMLDGAEALLAAAIYGRRFAFIAARGAAELAGPLARARFWRIQPAWIRLIDNTVRFGHHEELLLMPGAARGEGGQDVA
jgi:hypothetical protein